MFGFGNKAELPEEDGTESLDDQLSSDLESSAGNSLSDNPIPSQPDSNVFIGDVEAAKEAANDLEIAPDEEKEDKGHDPYNKMN